MIISAYKCDTTGKLFDDKGKYIKHLRKIAKKNLYEKRVLKVKKTPEWWQENVWNKIKSISQLTRFITENNHLFVDRRSLDSKIVSVNFSQLNFSEHISNSHSCPHNGVTNWLSKPNKPAGYPGISGRISYTITSESASFDSDRFDSTRIHTHGGGSVDSVDGKSYSYQIRMFFDDWPGLKSSFDEAKTFLLMDNRSLEDIEYEITSLVEEMYP